MNAFRIKIEGGDSNSLRLMSTLCGSENLSKKMDEEVQFDANALVILKDMSQYGGHKIRIFITKTNYEGQGIIFRSSRRPTFIMGLKDKISLIVSPGETFQIRGENAQNPDGTHDL